MNNNELKTIITLSGNKRLPDLEEEIFSGNHEIIEFYLRLICRHEDWYAGNFDDIGIMVDFYATRTLGQRWFAAEIILDNYPDWKLHYESWFKIQL